MAKECDNTSCGRESCEGCPSRQNPQSFQVPANSGSHIRRVIGVLSGKGGVGKSSVTAMLAVYLRRKGYKVGILDADLTGPSIPRMFGVSDLKGVTGDQMVPGESASGIKIMSVNLILEDENQPVVWRGPVIAGVVKQFWSDVIWGELDYLLVDMPPGTGDVALTVFQSLPIDGVFIVASPQRLVEMVVKKAYNMAKMMNIPVLGVVENFSYLTCPDCGKRIALFGESGVEAWCSEEGIPFADRLPMDPSLPGFADSGTIEQYEGTGLARAARLIPAP